MKVRLKKKEKVKKKKSRNKKDGFEFFCEIIEFIFELIMELINSWLNKKRQPVTLSFVFLKRDFPEFPLHLSVQHRNKSWVEIGTYKNLQKFITVNMTCKISCIIECSYVSRVFGQNISDNLTYRVIAFLHKSIIDDSKILLEFFFLVIIHGKSHCFIIHKKSLLTIEITTGKVFRKQGEYQNVSAHRIKFLCITEKINALDFLSAEWYF